MAWEKRKRGGSYYYRSFRDGERVRKEYLGGGKIAELLARADETARCQREARDSKARAELQRLEDLVAPLAEVSELTEVLAKTYLMAGGYHRRKGEWRMKRDA